MCVAVQHEHHESENRPFNKLEVSDSSHDLKVKRRFSSSKHSLEKVVITFATSSFKYWVSSSQRVTNVRASTAARLTTIGN